MKLESYNTCVKPEGRYNDAKIREKCASSPVPGSLVIMQPASCTVRAHFALAGDQVHTQHPEPAQAAAGTSYDCNEEAQALPSTTPRTCSPLGSITWAPELAGRICGASTRACAVLAALSSTIELSELWE